MKQINGKSPQSTRAVIYCRVASVASPRDGTVIGAQELRCREYAEGRGYAVERVFRDEAASGAGSDRDGVRAMLSFLDANARTGNYVVVTEDDSRLARSFAAHFELTGAITKTGARLEYVAGDHVFPADFLKPLSFSSQRPQ